MWGRSMENEEEEEEEERGRSPFVFVLVSFVPSYVATFFSGGMCK